MRRRGWIASLTVVLWLAMAVGASAKEDTQSLDVSYQNISIQVDGKTVQTDAEPFIVISDGRTYVPARALAEALGAKVGWDAAAHAVTAVTRRNVQTSTTGGISTYSLPYWGVSVQLPAGGTIAPSDGSNLLEVYTTDGLVILSRVDANPVFDANTVANTLIKVFQVVIPGITFGTPQSISVPGSAGAAEVTGTGTSLGLSTTVRMRMISDGQNVWGIVVMYAGQESPWVDQVFDSFRFPVLQGEAASSGAERRS